ncbi:NAD-dependent epimerase/dehydratase family protein [Streptococcus uberis]|uniref:NAD-dependent epimerase/dehydratase family protein n=1 Tax=Streptococcus uberis TaxID=1349 RepID=UPI0006202D5D|nr:NAD-dependent epimerase/dehydratase family protein [Streptococcus uberis]KKF44096.1 NAD-dependent epimerase [Streptococcus uberis EF20/0145]MCK1157878.1 NAD-dependent epimerase/dehydratase family protein [Streptococcus uberis]MCK1195877.1 NAD-dependent epimerase/dehydratase family protein [Streptococcus uberis]MCK1223515.1 NAD-dependent epimerase/dehydratase family protein [Streptococcus uberis]MTB59335.1 NAD-dependent epimerase/dehydratase family protein [Streptococcus uberis]
MKHILITGANSYIGTSFEKWLEASEGDYQIDTLDMIDPKWRQFDFSPYDAIFHVAAIVHKNEKNMDPTLYDKVNRDLPIELAGLAKAAGVKQFVFLSSMSVYGNKEEVITKETKENPSTYYGKSKLAAEKGLMQLESADFKVLMMRPPMVYGPKATGNYTRLSKLSRITPIFPNIANQRSMIYIDNLLEFVRKAIDTNLSGLHFPQNKEYVTTSQLVKTIRDVNGKNTLLTAIFNPIIKPLSNVSQFNKLFGNLVYAKELSTEVFDYQVADFHESVRKSEEK